MRLATEAPKFARHPVTAYHSVLVVEDDPDILMAVQDLLEFEGFHVDCAQTCRDAFSSIERTFYDAVLLDLGLPDGDGHSILEKLQTSDPSPPVIVLTATTSTDQKLSSLARGAFAFLTKPYHRGELCAILHRAVDMTSLTASD
ncbi:MAG: response regulator [Nitrospirae bacterium]|nr:response regulator [Nitrospirota bacterium]